MSEYSVAGGVGTARTTAFAFDAINTPHYFEVHFEVVVHDAISHAVDQVPGDVWMLSRKLRIYHANLVRGLANDLEAAFHGGGAVAATPNVRRISLAAGTRHRHGRGHVATWSGNTAVDLDLPPRYAVTITYETRPTDDQRSGHDSGGGTWSRTRRIDEIEVS